LAKVWWMEWKRVLSLNIWVFDPLNGAFIRVLDVQEPKSRIEYTCCLYNMGDPGPVLSDPFCLFPLDAQTFLSLSFLNHSLPPSLLPYSLSSLLQSLLAKGINPPSAAYTHTHRRILK
jgi:hypothetical protein